MKIDDTLLNQYLIKNLKALTEADPTLLADYVAALLKNSKPKKELQKLCLDQLYDFLGEGTNSFVVNLFHALDDGTVPSSMEDSEGIKSMDSTEAIASAVESRISPPHLERLPSTGAREWEEEIEEEGSSDEDRNHKHRRRVSRSRSMDRGNEPNAGRYNGGVSNDLKRQGGDHGRGVGPFDRDRPSKFERRLGREHAGGRFHNGDQGERGMMRGGGPPFRGDASNLRLDGMRLGRGRGGGGWVGPMAPPPFADAPPLLLPNAGYFPGGQGMVGLGAGWPGGFGPMGGMGSGSMEHSLPGRRPPGVMNLGMGMGPVRPRCLDFEERGFCLRGDLCPMDHGSHIVVEDVQSLSKFNLPVTLPNGRGMVMAAGPMAASNPNLPATVPLGSRGTRGNREPSVPPLGEVPIVVNGQAPGVEPDSYDPDQPLWNKDRPEASARIRKLSSREHPDQEREEEEPEKNLDVRGMESFSRGVMNGGLHGLDVGSTVWDRMGPVGGSAASVEGKLEEQRGGQSRGVPWQSGRWENREVDTAALNAHAKSGRGRGAAGWAEVGPPFNRPKEGTNFGPRALGRSAERAQRTLYVSCIPPSSNRAEVLLLHFEKFGQVLDVRIPPHSDRAFVQFGTREEAESALASPDAVMGNRFIRLSWANRDSISSENVASSSTGQLPAPGSESAAGLPGQSAKGRVKLSVAGLNGVVTSMSGASIADGGSKATNSNGSASSLSASGATASKKQEELELMREKIRQKQEALAQKRDAFRRKLDKLASQGVGSPEEQSEDQANKRQKVDGAGDLAVSKEGAVASSAPSVCGLKKTSTGEAVAEAGVTQPKPTRSPHPRINPGASTGHPTAAWGPTRFKLDNRTSVFRILPPLPAAVTDVAAVREHFAVFGELSNVEVEDAESRKVETGEALSTNHYVRVSYTTRRSAERAMTQGRWFHGQSLNLAWAPTPPSSRPIESPAPASKPPVAMQHEATSRSVTNEESEGAPAREHSKEEGGHAVLNNDLWQAALRMSQT